MKPLRRLPCTAGTLNLMSFSKRFALLVLSGFLSLSTFAQPSISSFTPASGAAGSTVTINGANFSPLAANDIVFFGAARASVSSATATSLQVVVPAGASYRPITVTTGNQTAWSALPFVVTIPGGTITPSAFEYAAHVDSLYSVETTDLTMSDLDGDGRVDIAVVDRLNSILSVYKNTSSGGAISFAAKIDIATGNAPYTVQSGDVDGDGRPDLVVSNRSDSSISIFLNTSSGGIISFAPKVNLTTTTQPDHVVIRDVDGDGRADIIVTEINFPGTVSVFRNTGTGGALSFATRADFSLVGGAGSLAVADMDGDGKPDLIAASFAANGIFILRNLSTPGSLSFATASLFATGTFPSGMSVGDLDGDGKPDIAVANFYSTNISVFHNTSTVGNLSLSRTDYPAGNSPDDVAITDVDGDGHPDVIVLNSFQSLSIYRNSSTPGALSLAAPVDFVSADGLSAVNLAGRIEAGDLDGDGKPDIAALSGVYRVIVLRNQANLPYITGFAPTSAPAGSAVTISGANFTGTTAVSFGGVPAASFTINSSGSLRAILGSGASGNVSVTNAYGSATKGGFLFLGPPVIYSFSPVDGISGTPDTIRGASFTNATAVSFGGVAASSFSVLSDSMIIAVVGAGATGDVSVTNPYGTGTKAGFTHLAPVISSFSPTSAGTGVSVTITGDHFIGVTTVSFGGTPVSSFVVNSATSITAVVAGGSSGDVSLSSPNGAASLAGFTFNAAPPPVVSSFAPAAGAIGSTVTITGLQFAPSIAGNIVYFGATRASVLTASATQLTVTVPGGASYEPISVLNTTTGLIGYSLRPFVVTFAGGGTINPSSFTGPTTIFYNPPSSPTSLRSTDFDGDGKPDIVLVDLYISLSVLRNISTAGHVAFAAPVAVTGINPVNFGAGLALRDVDGDGRPDIVLAVNSSLIYVIPNTSTPGNVSFGTPIALPVFGDSQTIGINDLDGDGKPDLVISNYGTMAVTVIRNTSTPGHFSFASYQHYPLAGTGGALVVGDLDGDGKPEIVVVNHSSSAAFSILTNTSQPGIISFAPRVDYAAGKNVGRVCIGDLNGDGKPEVIATTSDSLLVYQNTTVGGVLSFAPVNSKFSGDPLDVNINDVDGDGRPDIIFSNGFSNTGDVTVIQNLASGGVLAFGPEVGFSAGVAWGGAVVDFDGDGKPDLAAAVPDWHLISVCLNQDDQPYITSFSPSAAEQEDTVIIHGVHFDGASSVLFGGVPAASFTVDSSTGITAIVANGASGSITVTTPKGTATSSGYFTFIPPYAVVGFTPANGGLGTAVTITGTKFTGASKVSFGGVPASSFTVTALNTIEAVVGTGATGYVSVTTPEGTDSLPGFTYFEPPTLTSFTPTIGGYSTNVIITGTNLTGVTAVSFGGVAAYSYSVISPDTISAVVSTGASGNVGVTTPGGTASLPGFTFVGNPAVFSFSPKYGGPGTVISIGGIALGHITFVSFGGVPARSFSILSDTSMTAVVDTGASGDVFVQNVAGGEGQGGFVFEGPPTIQSFAPFSATAGTSILITGRNFLGTTAVSFGGVPVSSFTVNSATSITAIVGNGASGDLRVTTPVGEASLSGFSYLQAPSIDSFAPKSAAKASMVSIYGAHFSGATSVGFGGTPATSFTIQTDSIIVAIVGGGSSGAVSVVNPNGKDSLAGFQYIVVTAVGSVGVDTNKLLIRPNPAHGQVVVDYPPIFHAATLRCIDLSGQTVKLIQLPPGSKEAELQVGDLAAGVYQVLWSDGKTVYSRSLLIR